MKKHILLLIAVVCLLALAATLCACDETSTPTPLPGGPGGSGSGSGGSGGEGNKEDPPPEQKPEEPTFAVYFQLNDSELQPMQSSQDGTQYSITCTLAVGDHVTIIDSNDVVYVGPNGESDGVIKIAGEYVFTLTLDGTCATLAIETPEQSDPEPDPTPTPSLPKDTKVTVYYSNSDGWANVYVYMWNSQKSTSEKAKWPGEKLTTIGTNGFNQKQYSVTVDYAQYDRIIFNDGNGKQTKDLVVGSAANGYYGEDGIFTMNEENYGKVQYFTLKDTKNLTYLPNNSKKISVYTPAGYTTSKKYGVLYMFDSQNLYTAADGAQVANNAWAVDVAVTNLIKNGHDGIIIVAIDNADIHRDSELTMSQSFGTLTNLANVGSEAEKAAFRNGKLDELGNFMKETLMPYIAEHYSVDTSREKTGIAGSSSGGLAAYYLGLRDNHLYSYIGAFSPANGLFTTQSWKNFYAKKDFTAGRPKIYAYCGTGDRDLEDMLLPATKEIKLLTSYGFAASDIVENYVTGGTHNETYWRIAFVDFLSKMFG